MKDWLSLAITCPVPAVPPPVRFTCTVPLKPSAPNAFAFELVMVRSDAVPECSVMTPWLITDGGADDVMPLILASRSSTVSVTLSWLPVAPDATKVNTVPLTVMVSPAAKPEVSESLGAVPDSAVVPLTCATGESWLLMVAPLRLVSA